MTALSPSTPAELAQWAYDRGLTEQDVLELAAWIQAAREEGHAINFGPDAFSAVELTPAGPLQVVQEAQINGQQYLLLMGTFALPAKLFRATMGRLVRADGQAEMPRIARATLRVLVESTELTSFQPTTEDARDALQAILMARARGES